MNVPQLLLLADPPLPAFFDEVKDRSSRDTVYINGPGDNGIATDLHLTKAKTGDLAIDLRFGFGDPNVPGGCGLTPRTQRVIGRTKVTVVEVGDVGVCGVDRSSNRPEEQQRTTADKNCEQQRDTQ